MLGIRRRPLVRYCAVLIILFLHHHFLCYHSIKHNFSTIICITRVSSLMTTEMAPDLEPVSAPERIPHWRLVTDQARVTPAVLEHKYDGTGTASDPFIVTWIPNDPGNPMLFKTSKKWFLSSIGAVSMLATAFCSSAFSGRLIPYPQRFHVQA